MALFSSLSPARPIGLPPDAYLLARHPRNSERMRREFTSGVDDLMLEVFDRAESPEDPYELRDLWLARVEAGLGATSTRPDLAQRWRASRVRRATTAEEVHASRATPRFIKELFNWFFRDDLYGALRPSATTILSSGTVEETAWGLPEALKDCVRYALARDWYGYSDSRGRIPVRDAVAAYESARIDGAPYSAANVALTLGVTFAINTLADFLLTGRRVSAAPALCGIPNYPPLVEAIARRVDTHLVPLPIVDGTTSLDPLIAALTPHTPLVFLQTAMNPTGSAPSEEAIARLVAAAPASCWIVLDESHEWLGTEAKRTRARAAANVIRVSSISKEWSAPGMKIGWILADAALIDEYYEHASTSFGGPPSFFYTLIEVLARMERWRLTGIEPTMTEVREFERSYDLEVSSLGAAYASYCEARARRESELRTLRDACVNGFANSGASVLPPRYSINLVVHFDGYQDSYLCFREMLRDSGVAMFPGVLMFGSGGGLRVTTARPWSDLSDAFQRIGRAKTLSCPVS